MAENENQPLVSIITVNYNQSGVTIDLLKSLRKITYKNFEVIVVDNASPNDNLEKIEQDFPEVKLIKSKENLGFAGGNNLGIRVAKGKYLLFINNDTEVDAGFMEPLVNKLESDSKIGVVSPKIRFHHSPTVIQFAGYTPMNMITIRNNLVGYRQVDEGQFDTECESPFGHGAAMMVPMEVVKKVGLMADIYFLYYEEHDWFMRIRKAGYKIFYIPSSLVLHKESISTGKESPLKIHYIARNRIVFMRRNLSSSKLIISTLYQLFISFPKNYFTYLLKRDFKLLSAIHRAFVWNIKNTFNKDIYFNPKL